MRTSRFWGGLSGRWLVAIRAGGCTGLAIAGGWVAGDLAAGFLGTIGAFASLYASDRPFGNRALVLAGLAIALPAVVVLGIVTQSTPWLAIPVVATIAMAATFFCNALKVGPPGAYMIALACASGTALPTAHLGVPTVAAAVFGGGLLSFALHMSGMLADPRGPERRAVSAAGLAVANFAQTPPGEAADKARHRAAVALHDAWASLITFQLGAARAGSVLASLRALNWGLHQIFAQRIELQGANVSLATRAEQVAQEALSIGAAAPKAPQVLFPLGWLSAGESLRWAASLRSPILATSVRVGLGVLTAGLIAAGFGMQRAYWAMAAAVLILNQGLDWSGTIRRALQRGGGTVAGLGVAALLFGLRPRGLMLVMTAAALQFITEMLVVKRYALAAVFITAAALTIASGGYQVGDSAALLWTRGVDTVTGCLTGLTVYILTSAQRPAEFVRRDILAMLAAADIVFEQAAGTLVRGNQELRARQELQDRLFTLAATYANGVGSLWGGRAVRGLSPAVRAAERIGYRVLAACWLTSPQPGQSQAIAALKTELEVMLTERR